MKTILFHGQAGSGKDTQVEMLLRKYSLERIATGDMFRTMKDEGDADAVKLSSKIDLGIWPTPQETFALFEKWLKRFDNKKDWILVSVARYAEQIPYLDADLEKMGRKLDKVIHFKLDEETAMKRIAGRSICPKCQATYHPQFKLEKSKGVCDLCGNGLKIRDDDKPESIHNRFQQYAKTIQPWIEEYSKRGILDEIDASRTIEEIHLDVVETLGY